MNPKAKKILSQLLLIALILAIGYIVVTSEDFSLANIYLGILIENEFRKSAGMLENVEYNEAPAYKKKAILDNFKKSNPEIIEKLTLKVKGSAALASSKTAIDAVKSKEIDAASAPDFAAALAVQTPVSVVDNEGNVFTVLPIIKSMSPGNIIIDEKATLLNVPVELHSKVLSEIMSKESMASASMAATKTANALDVI